MSNLTEARTATETQTIVGAFDDEPAAHEAMRRLEDAGMPPDRIGIVVDNVRQAREMAGSYSPQGAVVGALLGLLVAAGLSAFGVDAARREPAAVAMGGLIIVAALTFIGWLAGRARVFMRDEYEHLEDESELGEVLLSVVCDTPDGADETRAMLERAGAREIRLERSGESV